MFITPSSRGFRVIPQVIRKRIKAGFEVCRFDVGRFDVDRFG